MTAIGKLIITVLLLSVIVTDANRARRRRRQTVLNAGQSSNTNTETFNSQTDARQQPLLSNQRGQLPFQQPQQQQQQQMGQGGFGMSKDMNVGPNQAGRQYSPYQSQYGMGSQGLNYYPYTGVGAGSPYGAGQYGQYGSSYNQYPGSGSFYSGSSYNRPGSYGAGAYGAGAYGSGAYGSGAYGSGYSSYGQGGYGGYGNRPYWGAGHKQNVNIFTVFLSSLLTLAICLITI